MENYCWKILAFHSFQISEVTRSIMDRIALTRHPGSVVTALHHFASSTWLCQWSTSCVRCPKSIASLLARSIASCELQRRHTRWLGHPRFVNLFIVNSLFWKASRQKKFAPRHAKQCCLALFFIFSWDCKYIRGYVPWWFSLQLCWMLEKCFSSILMVIFDTSWKADYRRCHTVFPFWPKAWF